MTSKSVVIDVKNSGDASPVAKCVQVANKYESKIYIECDTKKVNAKSIMGMMALGIVPGKEITILAEGNDEERAIEDIADFLVSA